MRIVVLAALVCVAACGGESPPCGSGAPGIHFVIHTPVEVNPPAELIVEYLGGGIGRYESYLPDGAWPDPLVIDVPYGPEARDGAARASFSPRPDPIRHAETTFLVDLERCVTADMTVEVSADGGV